MKVPQKCLVKLFKYVRYLLRQGPAFRGHGHEEYQGNYTQLPSIQAEDDQEFSRYLQLTTNFTSPIAQEEMTHRILKNLTGENRDNGYFGIIIDGTQDTTCMWNRARIYMCTMYLHPSRR